MRAGPEWMQVEKPLLDHLEELGWETLLWEERTVDRQVDRSSNRDVLLEARLCAAMRGINPGPDGQPWLDDTRLRSAVSQLRSMRAGTKLLEANRESTRLLHSGTTVAGHSDWHQGRDQAINYIDWDNPEVNDFLAVSQFVVATPGQGSDIRPDVVLFVNGIPLVVIEAKAPGSHGGIVEAVEQLRRYSNQRDTGIDEGAERLFWTNQFTVATTGGRAEAATFTAMPEHYMAWKDTSPAGQTQLRASRGDTTRPSTQQELLTAGMLAPQRLLDIVRHFCVFVHRSGSRPVKVVCRYQQYRAVHKALRRLIEGDTRAMDGHVDRRGGIIWHTQGSGKSLTMVFLIRAMRSHPDLRRFKIVLVTDRIDLESQLQETAKLTGETLTVARSSAEVQQVLRRPGSGLVMTMIQKYLGAGASGDVGLDDTGSFETLNDSGEILVLVDEAHRSHASILHANLMNALPNAARIGFTGTPIIMGQRKQTNEVFGRYIDRYTLRQSEADGSTVPIYYEGRVTETRVKQASRMDDIFLHWFQGLSEPQRLELHKRHVTATDILASPEVIKAKAHDMLRHYVSTVMPEGFKGMIVASSRQACLTYHKALVSAQRSLIQELEKRTSATNDPDDLFESDFDIGKEDAWMDEATTRFKLIRQLDFTPVISASHNDPSEFTKWTSKAAQQARIDYFQRPLGVASDSRSPLALLIVQSMLLTGFDAPRAQVIYLDRMIQEAELLQAVARVNRTAPDKSCGIVVDYYGVSTQLTKALAAYTADDGRIDSDAKDALRPLTEEIDKLDPRRERVRQVFVREGLEPANDEPTIEACLVVLADVATRANFDLVLREFLDTFDTVLPRPEALPFAKDVTLFGEIQIRCRRRYRDTPDGGFDPYKYKEKVRALLNRHITTLDLSTKIEPVRITDSDYTRLLAGLANDRARASEMEHAMRHHIRERIDDDPIYYKRLSERIDEILGRLKDHWEQLVIEFTDLLPQVASKRADSEGTGLDPHSELPFHDLLAQAVATSAPDAASRTITLTRELIDKVRLKADTVGFWDNTTKQDDLRKTIKRQLDDSDLFAYEHLNELAIRLRDLARVKRDQLP